VAYVLKFHQGEILACMLWAHGAGDPRVRAGQVSFRAKIGAMQQWSTEGFPKQMDVVARCPGEGCIAEPGTDKQGWWKGDLLTFGSDRSDSFKRLTGSAALGFIWNVEQSKRFLILLSRVNFGDV
jgi:hypothetical protein